jgi:2-C-methyl-D-erythritol 4-phosphate cytidylyltransferase
MSTAHTLQVAVVIPAAGSSTRFAAASPGTSKLAAILAGQTVLSRSVAAFIGRPDVGRIIVASRHAEETRAALGHFAHDPKLTIVPGGGSRAETVALAARAVDFRYDLIAIHDGARPLVTTALIDRVFAFATQTSPLRACAPALPVALTVKQCDGPLPARVQRTIPRRSLWALQTPQVVPRERFLQACESLGDKLADMTDDLQVLESAGDETWLLEGDERNLKITTRQDLSLAEELLATA